MARSARGGARSAANPIALVSALIAVTLVVFAQVRTFGFVNWDDPIYLTENATVRAGLSWTNVEWALTTTHEPYWHPLTWMSHMLDVTLFDMNAGSHHVTSLVIHVASTLLLFALLRRMTRETGKSAFVAAIFAVHPLHVESVAWLAERKDVLSTFLLFVTIWMYVRYVDRPGVSRYALVVVAYALALMAKPMVVTLPFVLLLLDFWPLGRLGRPEGLRYADRERRSDRQPGRGDQSEPVAQAFRPAFVLLEKLPPLALAVGVSVATLVVQKDVGAVAGINALPPGARLTNALVGYVTYLWKAVWPTRLAPFYPIREYPVWVPALAAAVLAALTFLAFRRRGERPHAFVGWLWFVITLAPVIGLLQSGEQATADRFMYVPLVGLAIVVAWGGSRMPGLKTRPATKATTTPAPSVVGRILRPGMVGVAIVLAFTVVAHAQTSYWSDSLTLWRHAAEVTDNNYMAFEKMGEALRDTGRFEEAADDYQQAIALVPSNSPVHVATLENNIGLVRERQGRFEDAERHFAEAARLNPQFAEAQSNYGNALAADGRYDDAMLHYRAALAIRPHFTEAMIGLGGSLVREGRPDEAAVHYREALSVDPALAQAHNGLASALVLQHRDDEAIEELNRALELKPDLPSAHLNIAIVLLRKSDTEGARRHLEAALAIDPGYEPARNVLARIR